MNKGVIKNIAVKLKNKISGNDLLFFIFLFLVILILRGPTLFNDYYDADELAAFVQTKDYIAGDIPGVDFSESKKFIYHLLFKAAYTISYDYGWVFVHLFTIFIVFFTSVFVYLTGRELLDRNTGMLSSIFYGVMISSFNKDFLATNGEIIYNLFLAAGLYFFIIALKKPLKKGMFYFFITLLMSWCAYNVKFHGIILSLFLICFIAIYLPFRKWGFKSKYFITIAVLTLSWLGVFYIGYFTEDMFSNAVVNHIVSKIYYASAPGRDFGFLDLVLRFTQRQGLLLLWHSILWIPAFIYTWSFIRSRFQNSGLAESALILFFISTYLMVFGGGARLYYHYFMAAYPFLVVVAAISLAKSEKKIIKTINRNILKFILIPALLFFIWNTKDVIVKHFYPEAFYNENRAVYWTRAIFMGTYNHYLLPDQDYKGAAEYIKETTKNNDRLFVWGDGPYINYFADRGIGGHGLWMKNSAYRIRELYSEGTREAIAQARNIENSIIADLVKKKPVIIADVSENGLSGFRVSLKESRYLYKYVSLNYFYDKNINGIHIYRKKKK